MTQPAYTKADGTLTAEDLAWINAKEYFERAGEELFPAVYKLAVAFNPITMNDKLKEGACLILRSDIRAILITACRWTDEEWWFECVNPGPPYDADIAWLPLSELTATPSAICYAIKPALV